MSLYKIGYRFSDFFCLRERLKYVSFKLFQLHFMEDGTLIIFTGDGGGAGDPNNVSLNK